MDNPVRLCEKFLQLLHQLTELTKVRRLNKIEGILHSSWLDMEPPFHNQTLHEKLEKLRYKQLNEVAQEINLFLSSQLKETKALLSQLPSKDLRQAFPLALDRVKRRYVKKFENTLASEARAFLGLKPSSTAAVPPTPAHPQNIPIKGKDDNLSNFWEFPRPVKHEGLSFTSGEQLYYYRKLNYFGFTRRAETVLGLHEAIRIKRESELFLRRFTARIPTQRIAEWNARGRITTSLEIFELKFQSFESFRKALSNEHYFYHPVADPWWGTGSTDRNQPIGPGRDHFSKLLMTFRADKFKTPVPLLPFPDQPRPSHQGPPAPMETYTSPRVQSNTQIQTESRSHTPTRSSSPVHTTPPAKSPPRAEDTPTAMDVTTASPVPNDQPPAHPPTPPAASPGAPPAQLETPIGQELTTTTHAIPDPASASLPQHQPSQDDALLAPPLSMTSPAASPPAADTEYASPPAADTESASLPAADTEYIDLTTATTSPTQSTKPTQKQDKPLKPLPRRSSRKNQSPQVPQNTNIDLNGSSSSLGYSEIFPKYTLSALDTPATPPLFTPTPPLYSPLIGSSPPPTNKRKASTSPVLSPNIQSDNTSTRAPLRKKQKGNKISWSIKLNTDTQILVIGDSNISRLPTPETFTHNWDFLAFHGADIEDITILLQDLTMPSLVTTRPTHLAHVIIYVGINHHSQIIQPARATQLLGNLLESAQNAFPGASIHLPYIAHDFEVCSPAANTMHNLDVARRALTGKDSFPQPIVAMADPLHITNTSGRILIKAWQHFLEKHHAPQSPK